ncbi:MAG: hypothetical protein ACPHJ3_03580 [Rubripirellula sp.]
MRLPSALSLGLLAFTDPLHDSGHASDSEVVFFSTIVDQQIKQRLDGQPGEH